MVIESNGAIAVNTVTELRGAMFDKQRFNSSSRPKVKNLYITSKGENFRK